MGWLWQLLSGKPHFIIGSTDDPYLLRWWLLPRNPVFNVYLHKFLRSDDDRALHDHPWPFLSIILKGHYWEHRADRPISAQSLRTPGSFAFRKPSTAHRVELDDGQPVWTLFITGPKVRNWGFVCPQGWRRWEEFVSPTNTGERGRGCE